MHASIEQLLDLRDAQRQDGHAGDPELRVHVDSCGVCKAEQSRLKNLRETMRSLPEIDPPDGRWQTIVQNPSRSGPSWRQPLAWGIAASLLVMVWLAGNLSGRDSIESQVADSADVASSGSEVASQTLASSGTGDIEEVDALRNRSRRLRRLLQSLPGRPDVVRAGTDSTIASLENSLAMVNYTLNQPDTALTSGESKELWQHKVNLMGSLVKVRYTEASFASL